MKRFWNHWGCKLSRLSPKQKWHETFWSRQLNESMVKLSFPSLMDRIERAEKFYACYCSHCGLWYLFFSTCYQHLQLANVRCVVLYGTLKHIWLPCMFYGRFLFRLGSGNKQQAQIRKISTNINSRKRQHETKLENQKKERKSLWADLNICIPLLLTAERSQKKRSFNFTRNWIDDFRFRP